MVDVRVRVPLLLKSAQMLLRWDRPLDGKRDLRIDWLRGLAMTCVIVDHSRLWSLLSWFTYERFWIVTAAEVFVVLSGVVLGTVYADKLLKHGWPVVVRGLARRSLTLYLAFFAVTCSLLVAAASGLDVRSLIGSLTPLTMGAADWRDIALMRVGPWPFQIVGLYVWLVAAAAPCLLLLRRFGWRALLGGELVPVSLVPRLAARADDGGVRDDVSDSRVAAPLRARDRRGGSPPAHPRLRRSPPARHPGGRCGRGCRLHRPGDEQPVVGRPGLPPLERRVARALHGYLFHATSRSPNWASAAS